MTSNTTTSTYKSESRNCNHDTSWQYKGTWYFWECVWQCSYDTTSTSTKPNSNHTNCTKPDSNHTSCTYTRTWASQMAFTTHSYGYDTWNAHAYAWNAITRTYTWDANTRTYT